MSHSARACKKIYYNFFPNRRYINNITQKFRGFCMVKNFSCKEISDFLCSVRILTMRIPP